MSTNDRLTQDMGTGQDERLQTEDIISTAKNLPEISEFMAAIQRAGLDHDLRNPGFKTLFAPSNDAMKAHKLPGGGELARILGRHIVQGRQTEADLRTTGQLQTLSGDPVQVRFESEGAVFGGARIIRHDVPCANGHIHVIDRIAE